MRRVLLLPGLWVAGVLAGPAAALAAAEPVTEIQAFWVSEHVVRGLERAGPSLQAGVDWASGPWRASAGTSRALTAQGWDETGIRLARSQEVGHSLRLVAEISWLRFGGYSPATVRDTVEAGLRAAWVLPSETSASVAWSHDLVRQANTAELAWERSWPLTRLGAYLDTRLWLGWSHAQDWRPEAAGPAVAGGYGYWGGALRLPYRVGAHTTLVAGLEFSEVWNAREAGWRPGPPGRRNLVAQIGVSFDL